MNEYSKKYKNLPFEHLLSSYRRAQTCKFIMSNDIQLWVEVGCGTMPLANEIEGMRWVVIEPSSEFRALVKAKNTTSYESVNDIAPVHERCGIIIDSLLHELANPTELLRAYSDTFTHPENIYRINVPNANSFHRQIAHRLGIINSLQELSETGQYLEQARVYTPDCLEKELANAGLEVMHLNSSFPKLFTNAQLQAIVDQGIVDESVFLAMDVLDSSLNLAGAELVAICRKRKVTSFAD